MYQDTIAAISTPVGEGGIGILRLSGKEANSIAQRIFDGQLSDHRLSYGHIIDPSSGTIIDEVLISYMAAPHTYTREDIVEINCHSGPLLLQRLLEIVLNAGARLATPGEFTLRAFLNGRIDLAQAEAVLDIIQAKTETGLRLAVDGLQGRVSAAINEARSQLISILAYLTATIDFPEDETEEQDIAQPLQEVIQELQQLITSADNGIVYRQGVRTALVGQPNVGKSSLLNRLLGQDRAIVTSIPGTTRDTIEETVSLQGIPFVLVDTAGILVSNNPVEALSIERSRKAIQQADLILMMIDLSEPITEVDREIIASIDNKRALIIANKTDLPQQAKTSELTEEIVCISALTGKGLSDLEQQMASKVLNGAIHSSDALLVNNPRHKDALVRAANHVSQAIAATEQGTPADCISIDVTAAVNALGQITGKTVEIEEEVLDIVFGQFCIGK